jgi:hypothetical protein
LRAGGIAADLDAGSTVRREWAETGEIGRSQQTVTQTDPLTVCDQSNTLVALAANEENARQTHKNNALQYKHWPFWRHVGHSPISPTSAAASQVYACCREVTRIWSDTQIVGATYLFLRIYYFDGIKGCLIQ